MKRLLYPQTKPFIILIGIMILSLNLYSQDIILLQNGDEIKSFVKEVGTETIKYNKYDNPNGPIYSIDKSEVFMITYKNGSKDVFSTNASANTKGDQTRDSQTNGNSPVGLGNSMEFSNQVYVYDTQKNTLMQLEKGTPEMKVSTVAAPFYASSTSTWMMYGGRSSVRLDNSGKFAFVVKTVPGMDPSELIRLVKFEVWGESKRNPTVNQNRHMMATKVSGSIGGASSENLSQYDQPFTFKKLEENVYQIIPSKALLPGEYTFYVLHKFYAFGID